MSASVRPTLLASSVAAISSSPPTRSAPDEPGYREVFATEAKTPGKATQKIRPLADGRRLRAYLATGSHRDELVDARWVA